MTPRYLRDEPSRRDSVAAALVSGVVAASVGLATFYFVRLLLAREVVRDALDRELLEPGSAEE